MSDSEFSVHESDDPMYDIPQQEPPNSEGEQSPPGMYGHFPDVETGHAPRTSNYATIIPRMEETAYERNTRARFDSQATMNTENDEMTTVAEPATDLEAFQTSIYVYIYIYIYIYINKYIYILYIYILLSQQVVDQFGDLANLQSNIRYQYYYYYHYHYYYYRYA